ncbi:hypothetical protein DV737_g819, partial [Chaetothyriales sp. CBS 132003]
MASPFTRAVVESMRTLYPECLADKSFDNTGLLLEAPLLPTRRNKNSVLLTIDLTRAVADEAIEQGHSVVVAYHPIIFRGLKSITLQDSQQQSLLKLAAHGVSVYSPHTAVDIVPGGMGDWLCDVVAGESSTGNGGDDRPADRNKGRMIPIHSPLTAPTHPELGTYSGPLYAAVATHTPGDLPRFAHTRSVITASATSDIEAANSVTKSTAFSTSNTGAGRLISFSSPQQLSVLINRIGNAIGQPRSLAVAIHQGTSGENVQIKTVGVCPGSGASVMRACRPPPDLVVTGEMSHHDALAVTERGGSVVTLFHSNSERGYLSSMMKPKLEDKLRQVWAADREKWAHERGKGEECVAEILRDESVLVKVSERDRDPFGVALLFGSNTVDV